MELSVAILYSQANPRCESLSAIQKNQQIPWGWGGVGKGKGGGRPGTQGSASLAYEEIADWGGGKYVGLGAGGTWDTRVCIGGRFADITAAAIVAAVQALAAALVAFAVQGIIHHQLQDGKQDAEACGPKRTVRMHWEEECQYLCKDCILTVWRCKSTGLLRM